MEIQTFIIDAFTDEAFKGNPAGVCLLNEEVDMNTMQLIASEINLSETAFLLKQKNGHYKIRYFTPAVEIVFCGHATLASARLILEEEDKVKFITYNGLDIEAYKIDNKVKMLFPLYVPEEKEPSQKLYNAFGITQPIFSCYANELGMWMTEVATKAELLAMEPDFIAALKTPDHIKELVVTCRSEDAGFDFYSRCFCPWIGINEDPVTGAAHSVLAKYWGKKLNKQEMKAAQLSKRGGALEMNILSPTSVEIISNAVIVFRGTMNI